MEQEVYGIPTMALRTEHYLGALIRMKLRKGNSMKTLLERGHLRWLVKSLGRTGKVLNGQLLNGYERRRLGPWASAVPNSFFHNSPSYWEFYRWWIWGSERLRNLPQIIQSISKEAPILVSYSQQSGLPTTADPLGLGWKEDEPISISHHVPNQVRLSFAEPDETRQEASDLLRQSKVMEERSLRSPVSSRL